MTASQVFAIAGAVALVAYVARARAAAPAYLVQPDPDPWQQWWDDEGESADVPQQLPSLFDEALTFMDPSTYEFQQPGSQAETNQRAFLDMLAVSEGTANLGDRGYNVLFGGDLFSSYADHPRLLITRTFNNGNTVTSSAAGRYQFLRRTWDALREQLQLPDFGPDSQDRAALQLIAERGALADVRAGRFGAALTKCRKTWASLPGAGYNQPEHAIDYLADAYARAGGMITA